MSENNTIEQLKQGFKIYEEKLNFKVKSITESKKTYRIEVEKCTTYAGIICVNVTLIDFKNNWMLLSLRKDDLDLFLTYIERLKDIG